MASSALIGDNISNTNCYQLKWHSFNDHLYSSVAKSLNSDAFTDVTLSTIDGYQMNAHRFVLSAFSQYFQHVFSIHKSQSHLIVILPQEISYRTLRILIEYMYCGETTVSNDILDNVLRGGDLLKIRGLWRQPENPIANSTSFNSKSVNSSESSQSQTQAQQMQQQHPFGTSSQSLSTTYIPSNNQIQQENSATQSHQQQEQNYNLSIHHHQQSQKKPNQQIETEVESDFASELDSVPPPLNSKSDSHQTQQFGSRPRSQSLLGSQLAQNPKISSHKSGTHLPLPPLLKRSKNGEYVRQQDDQDPDPDPDPDDVVERDEHMDEDNYYSLNNEEPEIDAADYLVIKEEPNDYEEAEIEEEHEPDAGTEMEPEDEFEEERSNEYRHDRFADNLPTAHYAIEKNKNNRHAKQKNARKYNGSEEGSSGSGNEASTTNESLYTPLACELCSEVFSLPRDWVRHVETYHGDHTNHALSSGSHLHQHSQHPPHQHQSNGSKKLKRDSNQKDEAEKYTPLVCDLCQKTFMTPQDWVRHIQNYHTDYELAMCNNSSTLKYRQTMISKPQQSEKTCEICSKKFPSHASMLIHKRTHTGERPFVCELCQKGFNVKSNLLRHLRTLHDKIMNCPSPSRTPEKSPVRPSSRNSPDPSLAQS